MKKIFFLINIIIVFNCRSQSPIISIQNGDYSVAGAYYKDVDNIFNKFVGTWKYSVGNESFTITLKKLTSYYDTVNNNYIDEIIGEYRYVNANGIEQVNTLSNLLVTSITPYEHNICAVVVMDKDLPVASKRIQLTFTDPGRKYIEQHIQLKYITGSPEKLELKWIGDISLIPNDTSPTTIRVPIVNYTLIKQQ